MGFLRRSIVVLVAVVYATLMTAPAMAATTGAITGSVHDTNGVAVAGADVSIAGPARATKSTDAKGAFAFNDIPPGLYTVQISKAGYTIARNDGVAVFIGETATLAVTLTQASFSSLQTIASVSTNAPGVAQINKSAASINTISSSVFADQGSQQVTNVLNETPGIFTTPYSPGNGNPSNGGSPGSAQTPQIRGALPYETESLIDGHPVSVGSAGTFSPNLINPFLLDNVEIVKGPGSMPAEINYAINGTVNYRTLEPTPENHFSGLFGVDKWGGVSTGFKGTGSTKNHKIEYAAGYVTDGAPGALENFTMHGSQIPLDNGPPGGPYYVNGQPLAMVIAPVGEGAGPAAFNPYAGMGLVFQEPLTGCCYTMATGYHSTSELGKILFNFSNNTSLKLSYLGGQSTVGNGDVNAYDTSQVGTTGLPAFSFEPCGTAGAALTCYPTPPAGGTAYNCAAPTGPACGAAIPFDLSSFNGLGYTYEQQNLFQGEFRTTLGQTGTVLARYYTGSLNEYATEGTTALNASLQSAYGTVPLCPVGTTFNNNPASPTFTGVCSDGSVPTNTTFNGQPVTFTTASEANTFLTNDQMSGETLQIQEQLGQDTFTLAYDRSRQASSSTTDEPSVGLVVFSPVVGSQQTFQTLSLRGDIPLQPKLLLNIGDYQLSYLSHYSIDGGVTWNDSTHAYNEPRAALTWQPNNDTSYRLSTGGSIAPPYISLVSSGGPTWSQIIGGVPAAGWIQNANNGDVNAETAWGYDLGMDHRIARATSVSLDLYYTQLHNLFLTSTAQVTGAAATGCPNQPCVVSGTGNLGQARYQGVEFALNHVPVFGFGWKLQGSLERAYTYNLPPYFYCAGSTNPATGVTTPPGPGCIYNTNLAVVPNVNFGGSPTAISGAPNGIPGARVPYASGYGELSWNGHFGQYYNLGVTYFGNNNVYNEPPFFVVSGNVRIKLNSYGTHLQVSADNLTGQYDNAYAGFFNGIPLPLVNGATQTNPLTGAPQSVGFAATPAGNYGPTTFRIILTQDF
ncbi:MAG TPA: TonB-dependent receptor [Candidatus Acidoferrum sp.]|nr:TonB-dependent receptor [Candidatus Acidoferrum sp.]